MTEPTIAGYNPINTQLLADTTVPVIPTPTTFIVQDVRAKESQPDLSSNPFAQAPSLFATPFKEEPRALKGYANESYNEAYAQLSSGEYVGRYETFIPGTNNEERLAKQQSTTEKWTNGIGKLVGKTGVAVLGGTLGVVDSLVQGISKGSLSEAYNTKFNNHLDDLNVKMSYKLPNYYTEQENTASLFGQVGTANFWADKVFGGLSFTAGALISEGIWTYATGGIGLLAQEGQLARLAKWTVKGAGGEAKALEALNTAKTLAKGSSTALLEATALEANTGKQLLGTIATVDKNIATNTYKLKKMGDIALVATRSAGYEAGMEARQYMNSTEHQWLENYQKVNGSEPTPEEYANFKDQLTTTGNYVFGANMIIAGASNITQFGNALIGKTTNPSVGNNFIKRSLLGVGFDKTVTEEGKVLYKALEATRGQKIAGKVWGVLGAAIPESQEEMGQRVVSRTAENYMLNGFDPEKTKTTYGLADAFTESLQNTYGTKEGLTEGLIGAIVGVLGAGASSGFKFGDVSAEREAVQKTVDYANAFTANNHINNVIANNKIQAAQEAKDQAIQRGDLTGEILSDAESTIAHVERNQAIGSIQEGFNDFSRQIKAIPNDELAKELGLGTGEEAEEQAKKFKEEKIAEYKEISAKHEKNLNYSQALLGEIQIAGLDKTSTREVVRAMAYSMTMGETAMRINQNLISHVKALVSDSVNVEGISEALEVQQILDLAPKEKTLKISQLDLHLESLDRREKEILNRQLDLSKVSEETLAPANESKSRQNALIDINKEITALQEERTQTQNEKQLALDAIGIKNYTDSNITVDMFTAQNENLNKLRATLADIKLTNPEKYFEIQKALQAQSKAVEHIKNYQKTTQAIVNPNTRVKVLNGWIKNLLNKNTKLNEGTASYFADVLEKWKTDTIVVFQENRNVIERRAFENGEPVSEEYKQLLGEQVRNGIQLPSADQAIYDAYQKEIEDNAVATIKDGSPKPEVAEDTKLISLNKLKEKVREIIGSNSYLTKYYGSDLAEQGKTKPSESDIKNYEELLSKIDRRVEPNTDRIISRPSNFYKNLGLTIPEIDQLKALQSKLNDWLTLEGVMSNDEQSVAEMLDLIDALQTQGVKETTKTELLDNDYKSVVDAIDEQANYLGSAVRGLSTPTSALAKIFQNKSGAKFIRFSHIRVQTLASFFPKSRLIVNENNTFEIIFDGKTLTGKVNNRGGQDIPLKEWQAVASNSTVLIKNFGTNASAISRLLDLDSQGNEIYENVVSDFAYPQINNNDLTEEEKNKIKQIDEFTVNSTKNGDNIDLYVSSSDWFNSKLSKKELSSKIHIYCFRNGKLIGSLPAPYEDSEGNVEESTEGIGIPLSDLRQSAAEFTKGKKGLIKLPQKMTAQITFIGAPQITLQKSGEEVVTKNNTFTEKSLQNVVGQGFIENGKVTPDIKIDVNQFINKISASNKDVKIPFIAFNYNGKVVGFPVSLKSGTVDVSTSVLAIFNNPESTTAIKAKTLVDALIQNGLDPQSYGIDFTDKENWIDSEETNKALKDLSKIKVFVDLEHFASENYNKEDLIKDATIALNLTNEPFQTQKIMLSMSNKIDNDVLGYREFLEENESRARDLRSRIAEIGVKIQDTFINKTSDFERTNANRAREVITSLNELGKQLVFDFNKNSKLTKNYTNFISNLPNSINQYENVKAITRFVSSLTSTQKEVLGTENVENIKYLLKELKTLESVKTVLIKEGKFTEVFSENPITISTNDSENRASVNKVRGAVKFANSEVKKILGADLFIEANRLLENLNYLEKSAESIKKQIKNSEYYQDADPTFITVDENGNLGNPFINEQEAIAELGGIKTEEEFKKALDASDLEYLKTTKTPLFEEMSKFNNIAVKEIVNGELVDKLNTEVRDTLEATLREPTNNALETSLANIEGYTPEVWSSSKEAIKTLLKDIEKQAIDVNVDLTGLAESSLVKTQQEVLDVTRALDFMLKNPNATTMDHFINTYEDFTNVVDEIEREVVKVEPKYRDLPLISLDTNSSEYASFREYGLLKVKDGVYIKTDGNVKTLEEVEDLMATNLQVFPENTVQGDASNKDIVREDLNSYVESQMSDVLTNDSEFDSDSVKKLIYYKTYFGITEQPSQTVSIDKINDISALNISNSEYLTIEYIAEVRNQQLRNVHPVLNNLVFNQKGITLRHTDEISLLEMKDYLKDNEDLRNYFLLSKNTNFNVEVEATQDEVSTQVERAYYANGGNLNNYKNRYTKINEETVQTKTTEDFIKINGEIYERTSDELFSKLPQTNPNFYEFNLEAPTLNVDPSAYPSINSVAEIEKNNIITKKESENFDENQDC